MILSGQNVSFAHALLQAIATASMASEEIMSKALKYVSDAGDANLYSVGVKTRKSFTSLQALFRGWLVRKHMRLVEEVKLSNAKQEYEALLLRKSQVAEDILEAESRLKKENGKLIRILKLQAKSRAPRQHHQSLRPQTAPSLADKKLYLSVTSMDEEFAESVIDMRTIQLRLKHKEKMFQEREEKLMEQRIASRHKEAELKLQEERITELADKIRKQHLQLKEKKLQFQLERSKAIPPTPPETVAAAEETELKLKIEKLKQKNRLLNKREAKILRMAKELKRREIQLAKREDKILMSYEQDNSTSTKRRRRTIGDHHDVDYEVRASMSNQEKSEQCSNMQAIEEEEEDTSESAADEPKKPTTTSTETKSSNHRRSHRDPDDSTSQSLPKRLILPQHTQYSNHVFTFEKNEAESDLGDHDDAQLRSALNNLRELL